MTNGEIARILLDIATMLEMDGANPFRIRAYREGARVVSTSAEPLAAMALEPKRLESIRGIGKDLAQMIRDLVTTGTAPRYEELKAKYPVELIALTDLQGVGPKKVRILYEKLGIRTRDDLQAAALAGKLRDLPGFGETTEQKVLKALQTSTQWVGRILLSDAWPLAHQLLDVVRGVPGVEKVEIAGSFRRRKETVGDLDLLACGGPAESVMEAFVKAPQVSEVLGRGDTKSSVRLYNGLQVDLRHVAVGSFGAAMLYFTGSKAHNIQLRRIAIEKGMSLNEYALTRGAEVVAGRTEEEVYAALGMSWIPPELREAHGEIELAIAGTLPRLIEISDLRADLHMHTNRTDGKEPLETMVRLARDKGYEYCAITDHSKALAMAFGFDENRVRQSVAEIDEVRRQVPGITVLHGLEVDILADGALDLADDALALLDWVIVSIHSRFDQPAEVQTQRVLRAISHPLVHAMGHPTGRMIGRREGIAFDIEQVLARAAELGVAMEINAQPDRTDLSDANARLAIEKGVPIVIDTDAHRILEMDFMQYGVFAARRAGLTAEHVLNTLAFDRFRERIRQRDRARAPMAAPVSARSSAPAAAAKPEPRQAREKRSPERFERAAPASRPAAPTTTKPVKSAGKRSQTAAAPSRPKRSTVRAAGATKRRKA
jgi:DNA polymerase (family X)